MVSFAKQTTQRNLPESTSIDGITLDRRDSMSMGLGRPESVSSSTQSWMASAWEPTAESAASSGRHLVTYVSGIVHAK